MRGILLRMYVFENPALYAFNFPFVFVPLEVGKCFLCKLSWSKVTVHRTESWFKVNTSVSYNQRKWESGCVRDNRMSSFCVLGP